MCDVQRGDCVLLAPGVVQGMITGIRGLCNGLGPALYGFIFYIFHVELNELPMPESPSGGSVVTQYHLQQVFSYLLVKKNNRKISCAQ